MTTVTTTTHKAKLIHKEDQIFLYREALFAKNKEAATPAEAWLVNVNGVEHKARTKKMAKETIDFIVEANQEEPTFELEPEVKEVEAPKKLTKAEVKANILKDREAAQAETYTIEQVAEAMKSTGGISEISCWYSKPECYKPINYGVTQGWLNRVSHTQVHWTETGVELFKATQAQKEVIVESTADADVLLAMMEIKAGVKTNQPNYTKIPMELELEALLPAVSMWERGASTTHKTGKVRVYMSKKLFNKPEYRKQIRTLQDSLKEKYGAEIVVSMYDINQYVTLADNRLEAHEFVLAFHYLNGWISKDANTVTAELLEGY